MGGKEEEEETSNLDVTCPTKQTLMATCQPLKFKKKKKNPDKKALIGKIYS